MANSAVWLIVGLIVGLVVGFAIGYVTKPTIKPTISQTALFAIWAIVFIQYLNIIYYLIIDNLTISIISSETVEIDRIDKM